MIDPELITCDDCQDRLEEFALDELEGDVRDQVARHLRGGCRACNAHLAQITAELATLAHALPVHAPPREIERDLFDRIAAQSRPRALEEAPVTLRQTPISKKSLTRSLVAAAAVLAACLAGIATWNAWQGRRTGLGLEEWAELRRRVDEADEAQRFGAVPELSFVSVRGPAPEKPVQGYIVADHSARQWHVYVFNLPALPQDRTYQLWFATGDKPVAAATAEADADGTLSTIIDLPSELPAITGLAISDEPQSGSTEPTGDHIYQADLPSP
jgi:anti-sigma-K factor RskA